MQRLILISAFIFFMLSGDKTPFVTNEAYAGCCPCPPSYAANYYMVSPKYLVACTRPGYKYKGKTCPYCAMPDSKTFRSSTPPHNGPSEIRGISELPLPTITQMEPTDRILALMSVGGGGECTRRRLELRLLGNVGDNLYL